MKPAEGNRRESDGGKHHQRGRLGKGGKTIVSDLLHDLGYSLQANRKTLEGSNHPDRHAQFKSIAGKVGKVLADGQSAISVDTTKKELVGDFKNAGREYRPAGDPERVRVHDFIDPALGPASPCGVYDLANDSGWVRVGITRTAVAQVRAQIRPEVSPAAFHDRAF